MTTDQLLHNKTRSAIGVLVITLSTMMVSVILAQIFAALMDHPTGWQHYVFALGVPAIATPLWAVPLMRANRMLVAMRREFERLARTDPLSGLPNRRAFFERARQIMLDADAGGDPVAVMMIDIDRFKAVNDNYGHDFGDEVIRGISAAIQRAIAHTAHSGSVFARVGGDEFTVMLSGLREEAAAAAAQSICNAVRDMDCKHRGRLVPVSVSVGLANRSPQESLGSLLEAADRAVYGAKSNGRNRWHRSYGAERTAA